MHTVAAVIGAVLRAAFAFAVAYYILHPRESDQWLRAHAPNIQNTAPAKACAPGSTLPACGPAGAPSNARAHLQHQRQLSGQTD